MPRPTIKTDIGIQNTILSRTTEFNTTIVRMSSSDVAAEADGKKIVKAGTFLGPASDNGTIMGNGVIAKPVNGAKTEGLLFNDVDVTRGDMEATMLYMGTVGLDRIPEAPADDVNLPRVSFTMD